jgi:sugar/nucleoside kinase (ribokinase family)
MNQNEANMVRRALSISKEMPEKESGRLLLESLNLHWVVFHNRLRSVLVCREGYASYETRMSCAPQLLTGAGDNFNAGLCAGLMMNLDPVDCLHLAGLTSGYYVEHAYSASLSELVAYIEDLEALS